MMPNEVAGSAGIVGSLARTIADVLTPLIPRGTPCALLDFPNHANVGDSAIWLGESNWLRRAGADLVYVCDLESYAPARLAARLGDGIVLLHGGGNLGAFGIARPQFREHRPQNLPRH